MATPLNGYEIYAPFYKVMLEGNDYPPRECISSIEVEEDLENPGVFRISLNEEINIDTQEFKFLDDTRIKPGNEVVIKFGYAASEKQGLIRGRIKAISPGFLSTGIPTLGIEGYDLSHDLQKTQKKFKDTEVMYSKVAEEIAQKNGLKTEGIESSKLAHPKVERKENEKDYQLLKRLSSDIGFEFFVRDKNLYFREPKDNLNGEKTFEFRNNFINFSPRMATSALANEVKVTAWDSKKKEVISETASISEINNNAGIKDFDRIVEESQGEKVTIKLEGRVVRSREEAKALALAELKRRNKGFIEGSLECAGDPGLYPGITVNIEKVGTRFSGVYYVIKAKHTIGDGGYKTVLDVRRSVL